MLSISSNSMGTYFGSERDSWNSKTMIVVMVCGHIIDRDKQGFPTCKDCWKAEND